MKARVRSTLSLLLGLLMALALVACTPGAGATAAPPASAGAPASAAPASAAPAPASAAPSGGGITY